MGVVERSKRLEMIHSVLGFGAAAAVLTLCDVAPEDATDEQWIEEMERHREQLAELPLGVYECPWPYKRGLTPALTEYVTQHSEFRFLKETSCDLAEMKRKQLAGLDSGLKVFSADAQSIREAYELGLNGYSGLQTNLWPSLHVKLFECYKIDPILAEKLQKFFVEYNWVLRRAYPASAKMYQRIANGVEIESCSFLNGATVSDDDAEWLANVAVAVKKIEEEQLCCAV
jgi:4-hydroxy-tetrahydrodipicolinate synthase